MSSVKEIINVLEEDILWLQNWNRLIKEQPQKGCRQEEVKILMKAYNATSKTHATRYNSLIKDRSVQQLMDLLTLASRELERLALVQGWPFIQDIMGLNSTVMIAMASFLKQLKASIPLNKGGKRRLDEVCLEVFQTNVEVHPSIMDDISIIEDVPITHVKAWFARKLAKEAKLHE